MARYWRDHQETGSRDAGFAAAMAAELGDRASEIVESFFLTSAYVDEILRAQSWEELRDHYRPAS